MAQNVVVATYPRERPYNEHTERPWRVDYDLAYDGGGSRWSKHYRTRLGARVSIWRNLYIASWGGSAVLIWTGSEEPG